MEINKNKILANWYNGSSHLDDVAYALYIKEMDRLSIQEGFEMTLLDQITFITLYKNKNMWFESNDIFYDQAMVVLRDEKLNKILNK